jgi:hypothetical protein
MLKDEIASLFNKAYSKLEEEYIFGGNASTFANELTEKNGLNLEKFKRDIKAYKESLKIPVRKSSMYPFIGSDGKTYVGMAFKKVKGVKNKLFNNILEILDLDGKCIVSEEVYENLKENHSDMFKFE